MLIVPGFGIRTFIQSTMSHVMEALDFATLHPARLRRKQAALQSLRFVNESMPDSLAFYTSKQVLAHALSQVRLSGLFLEFGVFKGGTIRYIAQNAPHRQVHGFDSFEGLPTAWEGTGHGPGAFHAGGKLPKVPANVTLHRGYFDQSLPDWEKRHSEPIAFIHVDCDLYSSTRTIFDVLEPRILPGVVIVFDEYFGYPGWRQGEHKALLEYLARTGRKVRYLSHAYHQVAVEVVE